MGRITIFLRFQVLKVPETLFLNPANYYLEDTGFFKSHILENRKMENGISI